MKGTFLIGELARLFNISTDTLRYYDKIDLLKPNYDAINKYRFYSVRNFFKLSRILFFKNLDISLRDIKKYMNNKNTNNLVTLLKNKEEEIDVKISTLINLKKKINTKLELLGNIKQELNVVKIKRLPQRIGVVLDINDSKNEYELKESVKKNEKYLKLSSWLIEGQVYTSLSRENMKSGSFNKFKYFIEILSTENTIHGELITIPENEFACVVFLGPYKDIENHYTLLIAWIEENGYEILGDSIEKNIVDYDFSDSENEYVSEIQIPIRKVFAVKAYRECK
ncbi:GyrI-like domain-containing protein [Clostridium sp. CF012]|uniref:GyrI-like domain-containing protein n=1 Tax=Clostridium sp. CF012 TaxID=2843319 RepID=UPI001C0CD68D|nr:GyrI-like domain-containing protein [Clostridium sp. CF012]MBU3142923.1 MerR family transcriptional regulator [Clostridium sp. CF012]